MTKRVNKKQNKKLRGGGMFDWLTGSTAATNDTNAVKPKSYFDFSGLFGSKPAAPALAAVEPSAVAPTEQVAPAAVEPAEPVASVEPAAVAPAEPVEAAPEPGPEQAAAPAPVPGSGGKKHKKHKKSMKKKRGGHKKSAKKH